MHRIARITAAALVASALGFVAVAHAQTPLFEVEKSDATKLLRVTDDAGFLVRGTPEVGTIPAAGAGVRLMWWPARAAFRAGRVDGSEWDQENVGNMSVALGRNTRASGSTSLALNYGTEASGDQSIAGGVNSIASGPVSLAVGQDVVASGPRAVAFGHGTVASGDFSLAAGYLTKATGLSSAALGAETRAAGAASVALGSGVTAQGAGSFAFGDRSTNFPVTAGPNEFLVRAFGGIGLNTGVNIGCDLPAGTGTWSCTSSRLAKEAFEDVDGEEVLTRLAQIPIQRWRYIGTAAPHLGPTAEDFHAAFGLGESTTKIATLDANGISLLGVQALERRTTTLREENAAQLAELRAEVAALRARMDSLLATRSAEVR